MEQKVIMHKIEDRHLSFGAVAFAALLLLALLVSQVWQVGAQGTDDSGGVILGPPSEGTVGAVVNEEFNVVNNNPPNAEPNVTIGGEVAETIKDDGEQVQVAAFAFGTRHSAISFSGSVGNVSDNTRQLWNAGGIDVLDVELRCLTNDGQWTDSNVEASINITPITSTDSNGNTTTTDYTYSIAGRVNQHGTCALFFSNRAAPDPGTGVSRADNNVGQRNRDVNMLGIAP